VTREEAFDVLVDTFGRLTATEKGNLLHHAMTWEKIACGERAGVYYGAGFAGGR
jgi:hypothetical protein